MKNQKITDSNGSSICTELSAFLTHTVESILAILLCHPFGSRDKVKKAKIPEDVKVIPSHTLTIKFM